MKIVYKGEKELKIDFQYIKFMERLVSVYTFVAEDFTLEIISCMSINESSSLSNQNVKRTRRGIVFAHKPIILCRSRCRRHRHGHGYT